MMKLKEIVGVRFISGLTFYALGMVAGIIIFNYFIQYTEEKHSKIGSYKTESGTEVDIVVAKNKDGQVLSIEAKNISIPFFENNYRSAMITSDRVIYSNSKPTLLMNPIVYKYEKDGKTIKAKLSGDFGEIVLNIINKESPLDSLKIWGNTSIEVYNPLTEEIKK